MIYSSEVQMRFAISECRLLKLPVIWLAADYD